MAARIDLGARHAVADLRRGDPEELGAKVDDCGLVLKDRGVEAHEGAPDPVMARALGGAGDESAIVERALLYVMTF